MTYPLSVYIWSIILQASWEGLEPPTNSLEVSGSIHLSYQDKGPPIFIDPVGREGQDLNEVWTSAAYETIIGSFKQPVKPLLQPHSLLLVAED